MPSIDAVTAEDAKQVVRDLKEFIPKAERAMTDVRLHEEAIVELRDRVRRAEQRQFSGRLSAARPGTICEDAAEALGVHVVLMLERSGRLDQIVRDSSRRQALIQQARNLPGVVQRYTGQTTSEFPQPSIYGSHIESLIAEYGVIRREMRGYPLGQGTAKPPRHKTGMSFGLIAQAAQFTEKNPAYEFASLEPRKIGGIVVSPRELFENTLVNIGEYLAELGAKAFAEAEDTWGFLADGTGTFDSVKGVCKTAEDASKIVTLAGGETSPDDVDVEDIRVAMTKVNSKVLGSGKWFWHPTWQTVLRRYNTEADPNIYVMLPDGSARLFGRPVVWTEVLPSWTQNASAGKYVGVFGDLKYWWFGKVAGGPRVDVSDQPFFDYDLVATRFIEEFDFDYISTESAAVIKTAAA